MSTPGQSAVTSALTGLSSMKPFAPHAMDGRALRPLPRPVSSIGMRQGQPVEYDSNARAAQDIARWNTERYHTSRQPGPNNGMGMAHGQPTEYDSNYYRPQMNPGGMQKGQPVNGYAHPNYIQQQQQMIQAQRQAYIEQMRQQAAQQPQPQPQAAQIAPGTPGGPVIPPLQLHPAGAPGPAGGVGHPGPAPIAQPQPQQRTVYRGLTSPGGENYNRLGH